MLVSGRYGSPNAGVCSTVLLSYVVPCRCMASRSSTLITLAILVAVAVAGCTARGESATIEAPAWSPGFTWAFEGSFAYSFKEFYDGETDAENESGQYRVKEVVVNTGFEFQNESTFATVRSVQSDSDELPVPVDRPYLAAYRQRDLKPLHVEGLRSESCNTAGDCTANLQKFHFEDPRPGVDFLPFPIHTGDTWGGTYELYDGIMMRVTAEAGRLVKLDTPLGTIEAMRIDMRRTATNLAETLSEMQKEAREEGYEIQDLRADIRYEEVLYFSPAYKNLVQYTMVGGQRFSATVPSEDGGTQKVSFESRVEEHSVLSGARLVAGPERGLEEIGNMLATGEGLDNVTGTPIPESTFTIAIRAVDSSVNAFDHEAGRFEATLEGNDALPEGHQLRWNLLDRNGRIVANQTGNVFEPVPPGAGRYSVVLDAIDAQGAVVANAGSVLIANHQGTMHTSCGIVTARPLLQVGACESLPVPVHLGATLLHISATGDQQNPLAELRVYDALGRDVPVQQTGRVYSVALESFEGYNLGHEPWTAIWGASLGVLEGATIDVSVLYQDAIQTTGNVNVGTEPGLLQAQAGHRAPSWLHGTP